MSIHLTSHTIIDRERVNLIARVHSLIQHGIQPRLDVVMVGDDPKSRLYVDKIKRQQAEDLGIIFRSHHFNQDASPDRIKEIILSLNQNPDCHAIIIQLPLPESLDTETILNLVKPQKDVDGLTAQSPFTPPTVLSIMQLLSEYEITLTNQKIGIVGQGRLVGLPLANTLRRLGLKPELFDEANFNPNSLRELDVIISATGQPGLIQGQYLKPEVIALDADRDLDWPTVEPIARAITPSQGAIGPLTVFFLLENTVLAAEEQAANGTLSPVLSPVSALPVVTDESGLAINHYQDASGAAIYQTSQTLDQDLIEDAE
ncbi:MAG: folD [Candidatus Berkelbacteria bacterium Gr01-1014_85]|uniref:FolD n=1 Tax=Candidatus Berkelbacteria bacterium Gr01-1014_85 TaxID=2017150 RepID=A0A554JCW7_9BACT|nr:MAG: folD [Candidatus Berkelbacteria bacterium Gr01-1014_85]